MGKHFYDEKEQKEKYDYKYIIINCLIIITLSIYIIMLSFYITTNIYNWDYLTYSSVSFASYKLYEFVVFFSIILSILFGVVTGYLFRKLIEKILDKNTGVSR